MFDNFVWVIIVIEKTHIDSENMENIKNFVNGIVTGQGNPNKTENSSLNANIPNPNGIRNDYGKMSTTARTRTDSECSNASISSTSSNGTQKDKDSYFWVMWHS